jgi:branched-chain amino acid transport system substrate-binding protein
MLHGKCVTATIVAAAFLLGTPALADIKIGMTGALSGPAAALGVEAKAGLEMAIEDINSAGGIKGEKVVLIAKDDEGQPPKAQDFAKQLVYRDQIVAFFASTMTTPNLASMNVTGAAGIPHIIAGTTSNVVCPLPEEGQCGSNVFRLSQLNSWQGEKLVAYATDVLKAKKIAILHDSTEYGQDGLKMLLGSMNSRGLEPVYVGTFDFAVQTFKPDLTKIQQAGADAIITWTLDFLVAKLAIEKKGMDLNLPMLGSSAITSYALRTLGGPAVEGIYMTDGMKAVANDSNPKVQALVKRYREKYSVPTEAGIPYWTITYYDAMHWLAGKIAEAGTGKAELVSALANSGTWEGTNTTYTITPERRNGFSADQVRIVKVQDSGLVDAE